MHQPDKMRRYRFLFLLYSLHKSYARGYYTTPYAESVKSAGTGPELKTF